MIATAATVTTADFNPEMYRTISAESFGPEGEYLFGDGEYGEKTPAGVKVNHKTALYNSAWWRAMNLVSTTIAKLPIYVDKDVAGDAWNRDKKHPAWRLMRRKPCEFLTPMQFKMLLQFHSMQFGNGYAYIVRGDNEEPIELYPLSPLPSDTYPMRKNRRLWYRVKLDPDDSNSKEVTVPAADILHIKGLGFDGMVGYSVVHVAKEALGWSLAISRYGARFFANNAKPNMAIETPPTFTKEQRQETRESFERIHKGVDNQHKVALLPPGAKIHEYMINAQEAQLMEAANFGRREIANFVGVPPHKVGDTSSANYNTLEQENQAFYDDCIEWHMCNWQQELEDKLLSEREKENESRRIKFDRRGLLRADAAGRGNFYKSMREIGAINPNEIRDREDYEPRPDDEGDKFMSPLNMTSSADKPGIPAGSAMTLNATAIAVSSGQITAEAAKIALEQQFPRWPKAGIGKFCDALIVAAPITDDPMTVEGELPTQNGIAADDVQATALNGAQILALVDVCTKIANNEIDPEGAKILISQSFPLMAPSEIVKMVDSMAAFEPAIPAEMPGKTQELPPNPVEKKSILDATGGILEHITGRLIERVNKHAVRASRDRKEFGVFLEGINTEHRDVFRKELEPVQTLCRALGNHGDQMLHEWLLESVRSHWNAAADQFTPAELPQRAEQFGESLIPDAVRAARDLFLEN